MSRRAAIFASPVIASRFGLKLVIAYDVAVKAADRFTQVVTRVRLVVIKVLELFELLVILGLCLFE